MEQSNDFQLRYSSLARRLTLRVREDGRVVVTAPLGLPYRLAERFVEENKNWVDRQLKKIMRANEELTRSRQTILYQGKSLPWRLAVNRLEPPRVTRQDNVLIVHSPSENDQQVRQLLERYFIEQARNYLPSRTLLLADVLGVDVNRVTVRSQRTRWGSCSGRQTISLNWRLMMAPIEVSDYVIYHELAHLIHPDHSVDFWQVVADVCPSFKSARRWLKQHNHLLHF